MRSLFDIPNMKEVCLWNRVQPGSWEVLADKPDDSLLDLGLFVGSEVVLEVVESRVNNVSRFSGHLASSSSQPITARQPLRSAQPTHISLIGWIRGPDNCPWTECPVLKMTAQG